MEDIVLDGLYIHDVNGWNPKANDDNGAAISFGANGQTYIDGLTIENCLIKDVTRDGITGGGYTGGGTYTPPATGGYAEWRPAAP